MDNQTLITLLLVLYALGMVPMGVAAKRTADGMGIVAPFRVLFVVATWPVFAFLGLLYALFIAD